MLNEFKNGSVAAQYKQLDAKCTKPTLLGTTYLGVTIGLSIQYVSQSEDLLMLLSDTNIY